MTLSNMLHKILIDEYLGLRDYKVYSLNGVDIGHLPYAKLADINVARVDFKGINDKCEACTLITLDVTYLED